MIITTLVLFFSVFCSAFGNVFTRRGMAELGPLEDFQPRHLLRYGWAAARNRHVMMGVSPALSMMATWTLHSSMAFFGDKFLVLTPFALGLAQFTLLLLTLLDFIARPGRREGAALGLAFGAALFIHSVVGWSAALVAGGWW